MSTQNPSTQNPSYRPVLAAWSIALVLALFTGGMGVLQFLADAQRREFREDGVAASAPVVRKWVGRSGNSSDHQLRVRLTIVEPLTPEEPPVSGPDVDGARRSVRSGVRVHTHFPIITVDAEAYRNVEVGDRVDVVYLPRQPRLARLATELESSRDRWIGRAFLALCLVVTALALIHALKEALKARTRPRATGLMSVPDPSPSATRAGWQVVWEYIGDPDPRNQLEASRRIRRKGWLWVLAIMLAIGVAPVLAYGVWGLFYPGLVLVIGGMLVEIIHVAYLAIHPDQRISHDGESLHFEGAVDLHGQTRDPQRVDSIRQFAVYPALGGFNAYGTGRAHYHIVHFWLADGSQRAISFKPRGYNWRKSPDPRGWAVAQGVALADALNALLPGRWREPPERQESVIDLPVDRRRLRDWGPMPPPLPDADPAARHPTTRPARRRVWLVVASLVLLLVLTMTFRVLLDGG